MKQITAINFNNLRNDEFLGLQSEGVKFAKAITEKDMQQSITAYEKSLLALEEFLKASVTESKAKLAAQLDSERNTIYSSCRKVAQASTNFPDAEAAETGAKIWKVFSENPSPTRINQAQSTGILKNIIAGLKIIDNEKLEACGFKVWLDKLETVNNQYIEADMARFTERGQRELDQGKRLRAECAEAYKFVALAATVKAAAGNEACNQFVESMNAAVLAKKQQVSIRKARPKQSSDPGDNNASDLGATTAQPAQHNSVTAGVNNAA